LTLTPEQRELVRNRLRGDRSGRTAHIRDIPRVTGPRDDDAAPLSSAQRRLWFVHQLTPNSPAYNVDYLWRITGRLAVPHFERAVREVLARHDMFRTVFEDVQANG
jgi:condensation domain-containing protein